MLSSHVSIEPVRSENEDAPVSLTRGDFSPREVKLTGNVTGDGPYNGTLRHKGWRVVKASFPQTVPGADATILAPAEVEL